MDAGFVHLRVHSEFSLVDSIVRIDELVAKAAAVAMPAVAVTDMCNLFAAVKLYQAAEAVGVKPIVGTDVWLAETSDYTDISRASLLCQDLEGYRRLGRWLTRAYRAQTRVDRPALEKGWFAEGTDGLILLSGGTQGDIGQALVAGHESRARVLAQRCAEAFPDRFYLEIHRIGEPFEEEYIAQVLTLADALNLPVVATNPVCFLEEDDFDAHEARVCIHEGWALADPRRPRRYTRAARFRSADEMIALFQDVPEAVANTVAIAMRCNLCFGLGQHHLPEFPVPDGKTVVEVLREQAQAGLATRLADREDLGGAYLQRLTLELSVIEAMGFAGYFLIVADFIAWAKRNDVPVGPGRGSGAGSLVAWALGITELDPIAFKLLFERFLNPERVSLPDFDVDFCMEGRDRVIEYVTGHYGPERVSQIITHGTMAAKLVVRDVGRVLGHPYGYVDSIAKLIPHDPKMTLDKAMELEPALKERYDKEEEVHALIDVARRLEGLARNAGRHAGGVVIAPTDLTDYMPLYCEPRARQMVTQFDMEDVEKIGLVKFDFLGLRTLTIIDRAVKLINRERPGDPLVIERLAVDDQATFALLKACRTTALFQLESQGMRDLILRLQPDTFEDIVALVALFRPGPLQSGMVDDFIDRKHGRAPLAYPHPVLEPILKPTYGVILYQEQAMQIAQLLSGFSLGRADLLRRAMGKKKPEEMAEQRGGFVTGAVARGYTEKLAGSIFDLIEKFSGYGFNRSHSVAYALLAYQTAWLKAHYQAEFMSAALSADMDSTDKVVRLITECESLKITVEPPDINRCDYGFTPIEGRVILYGLGAIKGVGASAIDAILEARSAGPFLSLVDLCRRVDGRKVNRRVLECLIRAGALDRFGPHRGALLAGLSLAITAAERETRDAGAGQSDFFGSSEAALAVASPGADHAVADLSEEDRLTGEKETLGIYLTGHPIARVEAELRLMVGHTISDLKPGESDDVLAAGLVEDLRIRNTRRGERMAIVTLGDRTGRIDVLVFSEVFQACRELLVKDSLLVVRGAVNVDDYQGGVRMMAARVISLDQARSELARRVRIEVSPDQVDAAWIGAVKEVLKTKPGPCRVELRYTGAGLEADLAMPDEWNVEPCEVLLRRLGRIAGDSAVHLIYFH